MINKFKNNSRFLKFFISLFILISLNTTLYARENKKFIEVESIGRAVLIEGDIDTSRKRALEDALYIAALQGGADINGFSAIKSNTIINDQSIVRATNRVVDFKILNEKQDKEFLTIKIRAVVGTKSLLKNCKIRPINITLFKGLFKTNSDVPSKLSRNMAVWYNEIYDIIDVLPNVNTTSFQKQSLEQVVKSNINPSFNYNALTKGVPVIQEGDYSLVPELVLLKNNKINDHQIKNFSNYLLKLSLNLYKGSDFKPLTQKTYDLQIQYEIKTKFQFIRNISTLDINIIDKKVNEHFNKAAKSFVKDLNCRPLEGKLTLSNDNLIVDLGSKQGLKQKQIGVVKGLNIENSMLGDSSVIVHTSSIFDNYSIILPLNEDIKLSRLNNMIVEFVE